MSVAMRCPECGRPTKVLSSRIRRQVSTSSHGGTIRRRECPLGHRNSSIERWLHVPLNTRKDLS